MSGTVADNIDRQSGVIAEPAGGPEVRSDDPSASAGTVWFNTTAGVLKVYREIPAWSAGGNLLTGRSGSCGSNGTQSACFVAGGQDSGGRSDSSEIYNGSSWSAVGDITGTSRVGTSNFGTVAAGVSATGFGTSAVNITNEFNGSTWTDVSANLIQPSTTSGACGTQTAGLKVGAFLADTDVFFDESEHYDGASWAAGGLISTETLSAAVCGTQTSAIRGGGKIDSGGHISYAVAQTYNGTSWSTVASLSTARHNQGMFGASDSDGNCNGGYLESASASLDTTEIWNGSSWAAGGTKLAVRQQFQGCGGSSSLGLDAGGYGASVVTEEYSGVVTARTITDS